MNKKELIKLLEPFQDDDEIVLLNDEFCEYFTPRLVQFIELGTFQYLNYKETSDFPEMTLTDMDYHSGDPDYKLISSKKYVYIGN